MKLLAHPIILPPALATACVAVTWPLLGPAWAAGVGAVGGVAWLLWAWRLQRDLHRMTAAMHRLARVDRNAALPMHVSAGLAAFRSAATDLAGMLRDVREHLGGERLRRRILEEALREGLVILDAQQRVLVANETAGRLLGFDPGSARGRLLQQCTRSPALNQVVSEAFAQGQRRQADIEPPGAPGLVAEAVVAAVTDEVGRMAGGLVLLSDVTAARSLDRMRADFAANVSHELRTPITNIRGYVETLLQVGMEEPQVARRFLDIVHRNASRLGALVEDLLTLAFVESPAGRERIEMGMFHVASLFDWVEAELGPAAEARNIRIERRPEPGLQVHANTLLAEQAVGNLVSNAIRYAPDGSTVELGARADAGFVAITVHDNGPGIPDRHLPRLFERFYRVDTARTREGGGTGLGLAIVKHIAMLHGGTISVQSTVGKGSVFTLRLPAQPGPEMEPQAPASSKFA